MRALRIKDSISARISDQQVIQRVLGGEKELYEILLKRHNQTLYRAVRSYCAEDEVEDVMQDAYIKAFTRLDQFRSEASFATWLIRIGINEALQYVRRTKRSKLISMADHNEKGIKMTELPDRREMNPEKNLIAYETGKLLEKAIDHLPEKYKVVYILREVEEMDCAQVAACLQLSDSNVKVRLHRAKNMLKEALLKLSSGASIFEFGDSRCDKIVSHVMDSLSSIRSAGS